jgi:hypothetical protein
VGYALLTGKLAMPLSILLPLVVFGILGAVLLINWLRPTPPLVLETPEQVQALWDHFNHEAPAEKVHLNAGRSHALVETGAGIGVLWSFGADPVSRLLGRAYTVRDTGTGICILTGDFTAPSIDIPLPHEVQRKEWRVLLESKK